MVSAAITDDAGATSSPSVLVVDDDPGTVETTAALLRRAGMRVHAAAAGEDALATARRQWLDLALIDYRLPGINGLQLASALRNEGIVVPWVIYSGFMDHEIALEAGRLGALDALQMPFEPESVVPRALARARAEREAAWRRLREGTRGPKPVRAVGRAAWWMLKACESRDDLRAMPAWGRVAGDSGSVLRREFRRMRIQPLAAQRFMRILRALAHVDGRVAHVELELAAGESETIDALMTDAGLHLLASGSTAVSFEYYLANQRFIPRDHPLFTALRDLLTTP